MLVLHLAFLVLMLGELKQGWWSRHGRGMQRSGEPVSLVRVELRKILLSSAGLEFGFEDNRLGSYSVAGAARSYLELLPCWDMVVAASGVDIAVAGIVDLEVGIVVVPEVDIDSVLEPTAQPKHSLVQLGRVFLRSQRHRPYCSDLEVVYTFVDELHC